MKLALLTGLLIVLAASGSAAAFSSTQNRLEATAPPGGETSFKILLYNLDAPVSLSLTIVAPPGFTATLSATHLNLPTVVPTAGPLPSGTEALGTPLGDVAAIPVTVSVAIPPSAAPGDYTVRVTALQDAEEEGIAVLQERTFAFAIHVSGAPLASTGAAGTYPVGDTTPRLLPFLPVPAAEAPWIAAATVLALLLIGTWWVRRRRY